MYITSIGDCWKRVIEETFPQVENIPTGESTTNLQAVQVVATSTGRSETLTGMNRGTEYVITEKERVKMLSKQLEETDNERSLLKREIDDLKNQVKTLSEKSSSRRIAWIYKNGVREAQRMENSKCSIVHSAFDSLGNVHVLLKD